MHKQTSKLEWQIVENDAEWERQQALLTAEMAPAANRRLRRQRYFWRVAAVFVLLVSGGSWRSEQAASSLTATNLRTPAGPALGSVAHSNDEWEREWRRQFGQQHFAILSTEPDVYEAITVQTVDFAGDQAVARVIIKVNNKAPAYRQTWFYRRTAVGWLRMAPPDANRWGPARTLTMPYFLFHFRQRDAPVVQAIAPQMDALYTTLWRNFGLPILPMPEQLIINVSVTQPPGRAMVFDAAKQITVASPARYLAPLS